MGEEKKLTLAGAFKDAADSWKSNETSTRDKVNDTVILVAMPFLWCLESAIRAVAFPISFARLELAYLRVAKRKKCAPEDVWKLLDMGNMRLIRDENCETSSLFLERLFEKARERRLADLAGMGGRVVPALAELLGDIEMLKFNISNTAAQMLRRMGECALPTLLDMLCSRDEIVSARAKKAIAAVGPQALPFLRELIKKEPERRIELMGLITGISKNRLPDGGFAGSAASMPRIDGLEMKKSLMRRNAPRIRVPINAANNQTKVRVIALVGA